MNQIYPWQQKQWQYLLSRIQQDKLAHGLLLIGPQGMGKLTFARALAERLLCGEGSERACGACRSCLWIEAGTHPDLILIQPEADGKVIKVDQIRELVEQLGETAQQGNYQVVILEPAEAMNTAAANALLKTLEEPAGKVQFILVSHQFGLLAATIRSRCQSLLFPIPAQSRTIPWISQQVSANYDASLLLSLAENVPLKALALAEETNFALHQTLLDHFIQLSLDRLDPLAMATVCLDIELNQVVNTLWTTVMDLIRLKLGNAVSTLSNQNKTN